MLMNGTVDSNEKWREFLRMKLVIQIVAQTLLGQWNGDKEYPTVTMFVVINISRMFTQICIFTNIVKKVKPM